MKKNRYFIRTNFVRDGGGDGCADHRRHQRQNHAHHTKIKGYEEKQKEVLFSAIVIEK